MPMGAMENIKSFVQAVGADLKTLRTSIGTLTSLTTTNKTSLVSAVNELASPASQFAGASEAFTVSGSANIALSSPTVFKQRLNPANFANADTVRVINSTNRVAFANVTATHYYGPAGGTVKITMPANQAMTDLAQSVPITAQEGLGIAWDPTVRVLRGGTAIGMLTFGKPDTSGVLITITDGTSGGTASIAANDVIVLNLTYRIAPYV